MPDTTAPAPAAEPIEGKVAFFAPLHVGCPARADGEPAPRFYLRTGHEDDLMVCEECGTTIRLAVVELGPATSQADGDHGDSDARIREAMQRPAETLGPDPMVWSTTAGAYHIPGTDRFIGSIGCEIDNSTPDRNVPLPKWGVARLPDRPLSLADRHSIAAFMAARWWAWALTPGEATAAAPGPRIIRPH